jgi:hypothetical protein
MTVNGDWLLHFSDRVWKIVLDSHRKPGAENARINFPSDPKRL